MSRQILLASTTALLACAMPIGAQVISEPPAEVGGAAEVPTATGGQVASEPAGELCSAKLVPGEAKIGDLYAICSKRALWIGPSTSFVSSYNVSLKRLLVLNRTEAGERVYMITPPTDGAPIILEDLTDELAASARGLKSLQVQALSGGVDISGFAVGGLIKLTGAAPMLPVAKDAAPVAVRIASENGRARTVNPARAAASDSAATGY